MAEIVFAAAVGHTAQLVRARDKLTKQQEKNIYGALNQLQSDIVAANADAMIVFGGDHYNSFFLDAMPSICIGLGESTVSWGDGGVPKYDIPMHRDLCEEIIGRLLSSGFDPAISRNMRLDHGFACPLHYLTPSMDLPIVPILINTIAPPLIPLHRAYELGAVLRNLLRKTTEVKRVAVLATGGLSHNLPIPHPDSQPGDIAESRLKEQMINGRADPSQLTSLLIDRIRKLGDSGDIRFNENFDNEVLSMLENGQAGELASRSTEWVSREGGNGGQEIRNWIAAAALVGDRRAETLAYEAVQAWLTGIAFLRWML